MKTGSTPKNLPMKAKIFRICTIDGGCEGKREQVYNINLPKGGRGKKAVDNVNSFSRGGNSETYLLRRLKRERPDLDAAISEELTA